MSYLGSAHLRPYLLTEPRKEAIKTAIKALRGRAFEAIAVTGNSGTIFGGMLPWDQLAYRSTFRSRHRAGTLESDVSRRFCGAGADSAGLPPANQRAGRSFRPCLRERPGHDDAGSAGETNQSKEYGYFVGATATSPTVVLLS